MGWFIFFVVLAAIIASEARPRSPVHMPHCTSIAECDAIYRR